MQGRCYYSFKELCSITGLSEYLMRKAIREKKLRTEKLMNRYRVTLSDFRSFMSHEKFTEFIDRRYLSVEKLFRIAGVPKKDWTNTLLLQSPGWRHVCVFTQKPDTKGEIIKVGLDPVLRLEGTTITSKQFVSLIQSYQLTSISKYE